VAAASVLAKVTRDRIMTDLHERYPPYEFAEHKGYVTERHAQALNEHGPCPEHRFRYANVNEALRALEASADADLALMDDAVADGAMKDEYMPNDGGLTYAVPDDTVPDRADRDGAVGGEVTGARAARPAGRGHGGHGRGGTGTMVGPVAGSEGRR
jgi:hypothetical protein